LAQLTLNRPLKVNQGYMNNLIVKFALLALLCSGCGTVASHSDYPEIEDAVGHGVYRGVRTDWHWVADAVPETEMGTPIYCLDMPFSLVTDTVFLPFDAAAALAPQPQPSKSDGQVNNQQPLYIHVGIGYGTNAEPQLSTRIRVGEPIAVTNSNSYVLTGTIEQQGTNLVARKLRWYRQGGAYLCGYIGLMTLEQPAFGGQAGEQMPGTSWVIVSTNGDDAPGLEKLKEIELESRSAKSGQ
jgi:uncharacterized protein YceK